MQRLPFISMLLFTALTLGACGGGGGGGGDEGAQNAPGDPGRGGNGNGNGNGDASGDGTPDGPDQDGDQNRGEPKDCDVQWRERLARDPVGQVKAYDVVEVLTGTRDPAQDGTVRSRSRETVVSASDTELVIATRWEYFQPNLGTVDGETRITKDNFLLGCTPTNGDVVADPDALARAGITILEDRMESITVRAGTFQAHYQKIRVKADDGLNNEVLSEHWTMRNDEIVVKEKILVKSATDGIVSERTTDRELIEYIGP